MASHHYDAVVVGAAYAGIGCVRAIMQHSQARVLLLDRWPLGAHQISACLAPLQVIRKADAESSVLQTYHEMVIHTPAGDCTLRIPEPLGIFDHQAFCQAALCAVNPEFMQARVTGVEGNAIVTPAGRIHADVLIDASGSGAVLATSLRPEYVRQQALFTGTGIETELPHKMTGLHFYIYHELVRGYAWAFGTGATTRFGVVSFYPVKNIRIALEQFLHMLGIPAPGPLHGARIAFGLRDPVVGPVFTVGDAAGQCIPTSGEGIRPALQSGYRLGLWLAQVFNGECDLEHVKQAYRRYQARHAWFHRSMRYLQTLLCNVPPKQCLAVLRCLGKESVMPAFWRFYGGTFPDGLTANPAVRPGA